MGARSLIGVDALSIAEKAGVGVLAPHEEEPSEPWPAMRDNPPWEVSYLSAVDKLVRMRRGQHMVERTRTMQNLGDPEQPQLGNSRSYLRLDEIQSRLTSMIEIAGSRQMFRDAATVRTKVRQELVE